MDHKKDADGKDEHERAAEQSEVQMKIAHQPVKPPSHATVEFSGFGNRAKPLSGNNLA
jgi:hypothetical protein